MSALVIVAAAYRDGWAFVKDGDRILLVRPPYRRMPPVEVPPSAVEYAVARLGFEAQGKELNGIEAVYAFLEEERAAAAEADRARLLTDRERAYRLMRNAPRYLLERYLDRAEDELLRLGAYDAALDALAAVSHPDVVHADDTLRERVASLVAACQSKRNDRKHGHD